MLGIPVETQRDRMAEALDVILRLIAGEMVDETTDWYTLRKARCQLRPYSLPRPEFAVASTFTPSGAKLAGKHDLAMLCVAATETRGYDALDVNSRIACDVARQHGRSMSLDSMRLGGSDAHRRVARAGPQGRGVRLQPWLDYFARVNPSALAGEPSGRTPAEALIASGGAVIGTPDDAIAQIRRLQEKTGAFGQFLLLAHNWASWERTKNSYALFARHVAPALQDENAWRARSLDWYTEHREDLTDRPRGQGGT